MTTDRHHATARVALVATGIVLLLVALLPLLLVTDRPERLATRWAFDGQPASAMSLAALVAVTLVFVVPCALVLVGLGLRRRALRTTAGPMIAGTVAMVGMTVAAPVVLTLLANRGQDDWRQVPGPAAWQIVAVVTVGLAAGAVGAWAGGRLPTLATRPAPTAVLDLADSAPVSWSQSLLVPWLLGVAAAVVAVGVVLAVVSDQAWLGLVVGVSGLPISLLARIEVVADARGLTVVYGPFGRPRTRVPVDRIDTAAAIDLTPSEWGGWGYRGSLRVFRQAAVVLRAGPAIRLDMHDGRRFAVTIDDPETAAAVINREIGRAAPR